MPRPRSVISPELPPRATKAKPAKPSDGWQPAPGKSYRLRETAGGYGPSTYSDDLFGLEIEQAELADKGIDSMLEKAIKGGWAPL